MRLTALPRRSGDLVFGSHLVLAVSMVCWRSFESTPVWSAEDGGQFTTSTVGRLLAFVTLVAALVGALLVVLQTARRWRDPRVALLAATFVCAIASRKRADLFDLVYAGLAIAFAAWWWKSERTGAQASA